MENRIQELIEQLKSLEKELTEEIQKKEEALTCARSSTPVRLWRFTAATATGWRKSDTISAISTELGQAPAPDRPSAPAQAHFIALGR